MHIHVAKFYDNFYFNEKISYVSWAQKYKIKLNSPILNTCNL